MFGFKHGRLGSAGTRTLIQRAIASLRARGTDAHLWLPGVGTINGLQTGNYLESTGNSVATVNNPVGLVLDALGTVGSELCLDTGCDTPAKWTSTAGFSVSSGLINVSSPAQYAGIAGIGWNAQVGKTYRVSFEIKNWVSGGVRYICGGSNAGVDAAANGVYTYILTTTTTGETTYFQARNVGCNLSIDSISVREVSGIHLTQATTANKPIVQRGAWNLALQSGWVGGTSGVCGSGAVAPTSWSFVSNTGQVAYSSGSVRFIATSQRPFLSQPLSATTGYTYTLSATVVANASATSLAHFIAEIPGTGGVSSAFTYSINRVTVSFSAVPIAGDRIAITWTATTGAADAAIRFGLGCSGNVTGDVTLSSPQLELGSTASAYSPTTTAAGSNPDSGKYAWRFDGSNDYLSLGSVPFQMGDDHYVTAAFSVTSATVEQAIFSVASTSTSTPYVSYLRVVSGIIACGWRDESSTTRLLSGGTVSANTTYVATAAKIGGTYYLWLNGVLIDSGATTFGTTTVNTANIGALVRTTTANYLSGTIYYLNPVKGTLTETERKQVEALAANAAGISF